MDANDFEWIFVVPEVSGPGDDRIVEAEKSLDDVVVSVHGGLTLATVTSQGVDAVDAGRRAAADLTSSGLAPMRSYPDLVTRQDIADRAEVSRQAVGNWVRGDRSQSDPFPSPAHLTAGGVWLWKDIVEWLRRTGRPIDDDLLFPSLSDHARIDDLLLPDDVDFRGYGSCLKPVEITADFSFVQNVVATPVIFADDEFSSKYEVAV